MYPKNGRIIYHVDCNSYFASCEIAQDPSLEGKPVVVAGNLKRTGMIVAANYIAREYGVYTTMPLWEARQKCPDLIVREPNFDLYREMSGKIFNYLEQITPLVEPVSIDEAYMDITDCKELGSPLEIAHNLQKEINAHFKIPVSIGIAPCRILSKMASDMKKPLGITVLRRRDVPKVLWPLQVKELHGCGQKTAERLNNIGIMTIGDLAKADKKLLKDLLGKRGLILKEWANGIDNRPIDPSSILEFKTIGNSTTLERNTSEELILVETLRKLAESVSRRIQSKKVVTYNIQITIRYSDFKTITRSQTLLNPVSSVSDLLSNAVHLFKKHWTGDSVRLLGISAHNVVDQKESTKQLDLFGFEEEAREVEKKEPLHKALDTLKLKFGESIIKTGADLVDKQEKSVAEKFKSRFDAKK
ncbi:MAG TPA: DNA polymerase IV [Bacillus sp. (in: firmicutes)]|nr:DNA polymerase IV [Bacillus sp. (in: firmicutes)]